MAQAIKTKDFRVLAIGTVLTQELRDEIFQALKDRDALAAGYGPPELSTEALMKKIKGSAKRMTGSEEDFSPPIDDEEQKVTMSPEDFSFSTEGDMDKPTKEIIDGDA